MISPYNLSNLPPEDQRILKEQLENFVKETSNFFQQEQIERLAEETAFVERESKLTGTLFLSLFVFGASKYGNPTLEQLVGLLNTCVEEMTLSRPGLHQRINTQAVAFFERVLSLAISQAVPTQFNLDLPARFTHVHIWDSTAFQLPPALAPFFAGKGGSASPAGAKIQFCYDFKQHQWWYALQSATAADNAMHSEIVARAQPGGLVLNDLGYFNVETFAALHDKGAYYLSRFKQNVNIYRQGATGAFHAQDLPTLLRHEPFETRLELAVFIRSKHQVFTPTRLIIERLPEPAANQRLRKLHQEAHSRGQQLSADTIFLAAFNFYVTNAPSQLLPAECCRFLYTIRWQIELIFKAWKSHLQLHKVQVKHRPERVKVTIWAKLIFITLTAKLIRLDTALLWLTSRLEISYFRAVRHFQTIAERWFFLAIVSHASAVSELLLNALAFIRQRSFKIPQQDRVYPLEMLQIIENIYVTA